jgi:hypothetical protein
MKNTEAEIEQLRTIYQQESLESQQFLDITNKSLVEAQEHQDGDDLASDRLGLINQKEQELKDIKNIQTLDERSHLKLVKTLQDAFSTVSRIMY